MFQLKVNKIEKLFLFFEGNDGTVVISINSFENTMMYVEQSVMHEIVKIVTFLQFLYIYK